MNHRIHEYLRIGNYKCISESTTIGLLSCIHEARFSYSFNNLVCHRLYTLIPVNMIIIIYHVICILIIIPNSMMTRVLNPVIGKYVLSD